MFSVMMCHLSGFSDWKMKKYCAYPNTQPQQFASFRDQIISVTHTRTKVYLATSTSDIYYFSYDQLASQSGKKQIYQIPKIVREKINKIGVITYGNCPWIIIHSGNSIKIFEEAEKPNDICLPEFDSNMNRNVRQFGTICNSGYLVLLENEKIGVFQMHESKKFKQIRTKEHMLKQPILVCGISNILLYDRYSFVIYDSILHSISGTQTIPNKSIEFLSIENTNGFVGINKTKALSFCGEHIADNSQLYLDDESTLLYIRHPYAFSYKKNFIIVHSTITELIREKIEYDFSRQNLLELLDNYTILIINGSNVYQCTYRILSKNPYIPHIENLKNEGKWTEAISLCNSIQYPGFDSLNTRYNLYYQYSESLFHVNDVMHSFEFFKKSRYDPFVILRHYEDFYSFKPKNLNNYGVIPYSASQIIPCDSKQIMIDDCKQYQQLLAKLLDSIDNDDKDNILKYRIECVKFTRSNEIIPDIKNLNKQSIDSIKIMAENKLEYSKNTQQAIQNILFQKSHVEQYQRKDKAINLLADYLKGILESEEDQTRIKIYNSILIQCIAKQTPMILSEYLSTNPPIIFDIVAYSIDQIKTHESEKALFYICEQYSQHELALERYVAENRWESLVSYIQNSKDCLQLAEKYFLRVHDRPELKSIAYSLFFAKSLSNEDINKTLQIISNKLRSDDSTETVDCLIAKAKFLEYSIYETKCDESDFHIELVKIYFGLLLPIIDDNKTDCYSEYQKGLIRILHVSDSYYPNYIIQMIDQLPIEKQMCFIAARFEVMKKMRPIRIIDFMKYVSDPEIDFALIIDFCDSVCSAIPDVYSQLFFHLDTKTQLKSLLFILNERSNKLDPSKIIENIPSDLPVSEISKFIQNSYIDNMNKLRYHTIQNTLLTKTVEIKKRQLDYLKGGKVVVTSSLKCIQCGKPIGQTVFVVCNNNSVMHISCVQNDEI